MKTSHRILLFSTALGAGSAVALWWFVPVLPAWLDGVIGLFVAAVAHEKWLRQAADKANADRSRLG